MNLRPRPRLARIALLYDIKPGDLLVFVVVSGVLAAVALRYE